jgi:SAM-dependent methyltransferase
MRYHLAAAALRTASAIPQTRHVYRQLCNLRRAPREVDHREAAWLMRELPAANGRLKLLELGTGWVHAYSLYPALLLNAEICCFDVWDNRSWPSFKATVAQVALQLAQWPEVSASQRGLAADRAAAVAKSGCFDEAYRALGITYHLDPRGSLDFPAQSFDGIFSIDVLEHVPAGAFAAAARSWHDCLRPGGRFLAEFDLKDHLSYFDKSKGPKHYLRYSERTWTLWFENQLQYFNRLSASQILQHLTNAGFLIENTARQLLEAVRGEVHPDYAWQSDEDIRTSRLSIVACRPEF